MSTITDTIFMIRPANFGFNTETAENNSFQDNDGSLSKAEIKAKAIEEFDQLVRRLKDRGINVLVIEDTPEPVKTDAIFPNNWISTHSNGVIITYPMFSPNRRNERRDDIIEMLKENFEYNKQYFFEHYESEGKYLESTGSMILDRENKIVYACLSERTNIEVLEKFSVLTSYRKVFFNSYDQNGIPIYHTNVMMSIGEQSCVICLESITDDEERQQLVSILEGSGKNIIEISQEQVNHFAGNMIQLKNNEGERFYVMSEQAFKSLSSEQIEEIHQHSQIIYSPLETIEKYGGGSARCMIAEIFT